MRLSSALSNFGTSVICVVCGDGYLFGGVLTFCASWTWPLSAVICASSAAFCSCSCVIFAFCAEDMARCIRSIPPIASSLLAPSVKCARCRQQSFTTNARATIAARSSWAATRHTLPFTLRAWRGPLPSIGPSARSSPGPRAWRGCFCCCHGLLCMLLFCQFQPPPVHGCPPGWLVQLPMLPPRRCAGRAVRVVGGHGRVRLRAPVHAARQDGAARRLEPHRGGREHVR